MELSGSHTFWIRETIKFNTAIANVGDAYDPISGQFEAPVNGTYLFSASMCSLTNDKWFHFHIMQDGNRLTWVTVGDRNLGECGSATAVTYMMKGSVVYVEIGNAIESPLTIQARHTFTAALLNTYSKP